MHVGIVIKTTTAFEIVKSPETSRKSIQKDVSSNVDRPTMSDIIWMRHKNLKN